MRSWSGRLSAALVGLLVGSLALPGSAMAVARTPTCSGAWEIVPSPSPGVGTNSLFAVYSASPTDAWAVGNAHNGGGIGMPLAEHWDGQSWTPVKVPAVSTKENFLYAVSGSSGTDVWAVGDEYDTTIGQWKPLVEHWDGASWSVVATPDLGSGGVYLRGVVAISPSDAWAVGYKDLSPQTVIEHWDGSAWTASSALDTILDAVTAVSSNDVWAVGQGTSSTLHWDGFSWTQYPSPSLSPLFGVAGVDSTDVWAVGYESGATGEAMAQHWDGANWTLSFANTYASQNVLAAVATTSSSDVWAVGSRVAHSTFRTFAEHFGGQGWSIVPSPNQSGRDDVFNGVSVDSTPGAWAVGWWTPRSGIARTLVARYC